VVGSSDPPLDDKDPPSPRLRARQVGAFPNRPRIFEFRFSICDFESRIARQGSALSKPPFFAQPFHIRAIRVIRGCSYLRRPCSRATPIARGAHDPPKRLAKAAPRFPRLLQ
jgi:hypothetical protein